MNRETAAVLRNLLLLILQLATTGTASWSFNIKSTPLTCRSICNWMNVNVETRSNGMFPSWESPLAESRLTGNVRWTDLEGLKMDSFLGNELLSAGAADTCDFFNFASITSLPSFGAQPQTGIQLIWRNAYVLVQLRMYLYKHKGWGNAIREQLDRSLYGHHHHARLYVLYHIIWFMHGGTGFAFSTDIHSILEEYEGFIQEDERHHNNFMSRIRMTEST